MRIEGPLSIAALAMLCPIVSFGQAQQTTPTLQVNARVETMIPAERASLYIVLEEHAREPAEAASRVGALESAVISALRAQRVTPEQVTVTSYGVTPVRPTRPGELPTGQYTGRSAIRVEVTRLDQLAAITTAALGAGAVVVGDPRFTSVREDAARDELVTSALAQARRQAQIAAAAAGATLGRLRNVNILPDPRFEQPTMSLPGETSYAPRATPIPEVRVMVQVSTSWELVLP